MNRAKVHRQARPTNNESVNERLSHRDKVSAAMTKNDRLERWWIGTAKSPSTYATVVHADLSNPA